MTDADHTERSETLLLHKGVVMLSGYDNEYLPGLAKDEHSGQRAIACSGLMNY